MTTSPPIPSSPSAPTAAGSSRRRLADLPLGVRIMGVVGLLVALMAATNGYAVEQVRSLRDGQSQLYSQNVRPLSLLSDIQRSFQGDRARVIQYGIADAETRATLRQELTERQGEITALIDTYTPSAVDADALADLQGQLATYYGMTEPLFALADAGDAAGFATTFNEEIRPQTTAVMDAMALETQAQADEGAARAAAGADAAATSITIMFSLLGAGALLGLLVGLVVSRGVTRSVSAVHRVAEGVAAGDLTRSTGLDQRDEVGRMAASLDSAMVSLRGVMSSVGASSDAVASASEELSASSSQISAAAQETSAQSGVVSTAAEEVSRNVATVAAGAEEMGVSIREIAQNTNEAARVAHQAVSAAATATATVSKLGASSQQIGDVVKTITSIAEQTNLLALNATIEAARAGEAGKGFAVVANEVKELAQETARATDDISKRVATIQADTTGAVAAIDEITAIIASINDFQTTIASAVEEQTATTQEMSRSVNEAAGGSNEIALNITGVSGAAESTTRALDLTRVAVEELAVLASDLKTQITRFTY